MIVLAKEYGLTHTLGVCVLSCARARVKMMWARQVGALVLRVFVFYCLYAVHTGSICIISDLSNQTV